MNAQNSHIVCEEQKVKKKEYFDRFKVKTNTHNSKAGYVLSLDFYKMLNSKRKIKKLQAIY